MTNTAEQRAALQRTAKRRLTVLPRASSDAVALWSAVVEAVDAIARVEALFVPGADFEPCPASNGCSHGECDTAYAVLAAINGRSTT